MTLVVHYFYLDALTLSSSGNFYLKKQTNNVVVMEKNSDLISQIYNKV